MRSSVKAVKLGKVLAFSRGITWSHGQERRSPGPNRYPVIRIPNLQTRLNLDDILFLEVPRGGRFSDCVTRKGDILLVGSNGNPARVGNAIQIEAEENFLFASFLIAGRLRDPEAHSQRFVFHVFTSPEIQSRIAKSVQGTTGLSNLSLRFLDSLPFPDFAIMEQSRIAKILDTAGEAIEKTESIIKKLKMMRIGIMHDLLTRGLAKNGELRPHPSEAPELYRENKGEFIPRDWVTDKLKTRADVYGGKRLPSGHVYADSQTRWRYLRVVDFYQKPIDFDEIECLPENTFKALSRYEISNGNLFISIAGSLGFAGVLDSPSELRVIITENAARIEVGASLVPKFLAIQINAPRVQRQIHLETGIGGGVPKLALFRIENLTIVVPSRTEQQMIVERLDSIDTSLRAAVSECQKLKNVKAGLMSDLMSGRTSA